MVMMVQGWCVNDRDDFMYYAVITDNVFACHPLLPPVPSSLLPSPRGWVTGDVAHVLTHTSGGERRTGKRDLLREMVEGLGS